jgi:Uma2 family endonuclease
MASVSAPVRKHLTDIHEWQRLGEANIFPPNSRLELIEGEILEMAPIGCKHAGHLMRIMHYFAQIVGENALLNAQNPLQLGDLSEPEPDFMLLRPRADFYSSQHPVATDVLLLIEIADSSLAFDQTQKLRLYAMHHIAEYWIINLNDHCLEVYREPSGENYAQKTSLRIGQHASVLLLPEISVNIAQLLGTP